MAQSYTEMYAREALNIYSSTWTGANGATLTLTGCVVTLRNPAGDAVFTNQPATGLAPPGNSVYAWYFIDATSSGLNLPTDPNNPYILTFVATDASGQKLESVVELLVKSDAD